MLQNGIYDIRFIAKKIRGGNYNKLEIRTLRRVRYQI